MITLPSTNIILIASGFSVYLAIVYLLNKQSIKKFEYSFFAKEPFIVMMACTVFLLIGIKFLPKNLIEINFTSIISYLSLAASVASLCLLVWANCKRTNWWHGLLGSLIQIPLLLLSSVIWIPVLLISGFFKFLLLFDSGPRPLGKTRFQKDQEWYYNRQNPNGFYKYNR